MTAGKIRYLVPLVFLSLCVSASPLRQAAPADVIARFHINEAAYLSDVGKYLEALEELDTAYNFSESPDLKAEALASQAQLLAGFLDDPRTALVHYGNILQNFRASTAYPSAMFQAAMLRFDVQDMDGSRNLFEQFRKEFPADPRAMTAEFMVGRAAPVMVPAPVTVPAPVAVPAPVQPPVVAPPPPPAPARNVNTPQVKAAPEHRLRIALKLASSVTLTSNQTLSIEGKPSGTTLQASASSLTDDTVSVEAAGPIRVDGTAYRGRIVLMREGESVRVVNDLPVEEYLYSVVPAEVPASWPIEALKSQAVAARTYAHYHIRHPRSPGRFDVFNDIRSQVYGGVAKETAQTTRAVEATRGQVLMHGGRVILAYFTSNNGGASADPAVVFGETMPYLKSVKDAASAGQPNGKWTRRFSRADVEEALRKSGYAVTGIRRFVPLKTCPSGRVVQVAIEHDGGLLKLNTRTQLRRAINNNIKLSPSPQPPENLPEILMSIIVSGDSIEMAGGGWGHGVGLSQYGARGMAQAGASYKNILATYYIGAELKSI